jgi:hypothetical protein
VGLAQHGFLSGSLLSEAEFVVGALAPKFVVGALAPKFVVGALAACVCTEVPVFRYERIHKT